MSVLCRRGVAVRANVERFPAEWRYLICILLNAYRLFSVYFNRSGGRILFSEELWVGVIVLGQGVFFSQFILAGIGLC